MSRGCRQQSGFTLLELVLAFVLLAMALGLMIGVVSRGLRQMQWSTHATEASLYAQSKLDALGVMERIAPGSEQGEFGDGAYRWRQEIREVPDPSAPETDHAMPAPLPTSVLYRVSLDVSWGDAQAAQTLHFATLRALSPPGPGS